MSNIKFHGVMPALVSPVNEDGTLRRGVVKPLVDFMLEAGCTGFYVCGATGEGVVMQPEARMEMVEAVVEAVSGHKLPDGSRPYVIDHIGAVDLLTAKKLAAHAAAAGADTEVCRRLMTAATTDSCIEIMQAASVAEQTLASIVDSIQWQLDHRVRDNFRIGAMTFSNVYGVLGITDTGQELMDKWRREGALQ